MKQLPILLSFLLTGTLFCHAQTGQDLVDATSSFLETLSNDQKEKVLFEFEDPQRQKWTNLPVGIVPRAGLQYGLLSDEGRIAFHRVLGSFLSSQGYLKTSGIMHLDNVLNATYDLAFEEGTINQQQLDRMRNLEWGLSNYYIAIWGTPQMEKPWGFKLGGHHMSVNVTLNKEGFNITPLFLGTDPSEVRSTPYAGWRVLSKEEDYGFMLVNALTDAQRKTATMSGDVPGDIITSPNSSQRIDDYYGIKGSDLNDQQKGLLEILIQEYVHNLEHGKAHEEMEKILAAGLDNVYFAWIGSYEPRQPHYYILNGPTFLIEYDNVGFQNDGNHIHCIWREKGNDFGVDLLKDHYLENQH